MQLDIRTKETYIGQKKSQYIPQIIHIKRLIDQYVNIKTIKLLEKSIGENFCDLRIGKNFRQVTKSYIRNCWWIQFSLVTQSCPTLCNTIDCSKPGFPVHHQLPELAQTHVHRVSNAIQPSHPLSSPSHAFNLSQHQGFSNESVFQIRCPKYWSFSFNISPSNDYSGLISLWLTGWISLQYKELSRVFSNTTVQKHQFFSA